MVLVKYNYDLGPLSSVTELNKWTVATSKYKGGGRGYSYPASHNYIDTHVGGVLFSPLPL